jgi:DNA-binding beta-propeller fold protein YncE
MVSGFDYVIDPFYTAMQGVTCGPQLPKGVADSTMDKMVYVNDTDCKPKP